MDKHLTLDGLQEECRSRTSCLPTCLARNPAGLVLGGCGGKIRSGPPAPAPQLLFPFFSIFF